MDITQWIGFFISVMALLFLLTRNIKEVRQQRTHPEEYKKKQREQEHQLKKMLKDFDIDVEDEEEEQIILKEQHVPKLPKMPVIIAPKTQAIKIENVQTSRRKTQVAKIIYSGPSKGQQILSRLHSPKEIIVLQELIGPPKSVKPISYHEYWG